jgi:uncharacterized protein (TIGR00369 family)
MDDPTAPMDYSELANAVRGGFEQALGLAFTRVTPDEVVAELPITPALHQPYGLVHGGVYASLIETVCSTGAGVCAALEGRSSVGQDNATQFLRGTRQGTLTARALPVHKGRRTHVWSAEVRDGEGRLVATGTVRLMIVEPDEGVGGAPVRLPGALRA